MFTSGFENLRQMIAVVRFENKQIPGSFKLRPHGKLNRLLQYPDTCTLIAANHQGLAVLVK